MRRLPERSAAYHGAVTVLLASENAAFGMRLAEAPHTYDDAVEHGRDDVTITVGPFDGGGFFVEDDSPGIPPCARKCSNTATPPVGTGLASG